MQCGNRIPSQVIPVLISTPAWSSPVPSPAHQPNQAPVTEAKTKIFARPTSTAGAASSAAASSSAGGASAAASSSDMGTNCSDAYAEVFHAAAAQRRPSGDCQ